MQVVVYFNFDFVDYVLFFINRTWQEAYDQLESIHVQL